MLAKAAFLFRVPSCGVSGTLPTLLLMLPRRYLSFFSPLPDIDSDVADAHYPRAALPPTWAVCCTRTRLAASRTQ